LERIQQNARSGYVVSWDAVYGECAINGRDKEALKHFDYMHEEGVQQDDVTFLCLLSACSHAGSVDEAMSCYTSMIRVYMGSPKLEHYTCMVDVFVVLAIYRNQRI
jgi:pentatricopeptide repeat protein